MSFLLETDQVLECRTDKMVTRVERAIDDDDDDDDDDDERSKGARVQLTWATMTKCLALNFFSNSRTSLDWIFWKLLSCGTGTNKMTAFLPP